MLGASEGRDKPLDQDAVHPHGSCPVGLILTVEKCRVTGQGSITPRGALECRAGPGRGAGRDGRCDPYSPGSSPFA